MRAAAAAFSQGLRSSFSGPPSRELILPPNKQTKDKDLESIYTMGDKVGGSSRCSVHSCVEVASGEQCCLKVVKRDKFGQHENLPQELRREAELASQFEMQPHPNVCMPIKVIETRTQVVVEMDYLPGGDLLTFLTPSPSLRWMDESHPLRIITQLLRAIEFLHRNRIIHGDIKPENILLTRAPPPPNPGDVTVTAPGCIYKLCDFGASLTLPSEASYLQNITVGTEGYISPEAREGVVGFPSDMWSFGITAFVIGTGELPYEPTDAAAMEQFFKAPKEELKKHPRWKRMSRGLRRLITECTARDPDERLTIGAALQSDCLPGREGGDKKRKGPST
ncbi:hypothetical protein TrCOL_g226 [Triparma columacea]|uniref:Protein kinase domain-containing protein n=1 Tax=Triparma columacea TaxID=722753 RepID=A0A9W7G453_9STRA|nr:hypothetical protein TrCOL_g226 [Triparma columacea]